MDTGKVRVRSGTSPPAPESQLCWRSSLVGVVLISMVVVAVVMVIIVFMFMTKMFMTTMYHDLWSGLRSWLCRCDSDCEYDCDHDMMMIVVVIMVVNMASMSMAYGIDYAYV